MNLLQLCMALEMMLIKTMDKVALGLDQQVGLERVLEIHSVTLMAMSIDLRLLIWTRSYVTRSCIHSMDVKLVTVEIDFSQVHRNACLDNNVTCFFSLSWWQYIKTLSMTFMQPQRNSFFSLLWHNLHMTKRKRTRDFLFALTFQVKHRSFFK